MTLAEIAEAMEVLEVAVRRERGALKLMIASEDLVTEPERQGGIMKMSQRLAGFLDDFDELRQMVEAAERAQPGDGDVQPGGGHIGEAQ